MMKKPKMFILSLSVMIVAGLTLTAAGVSFAACPDQLAAYWKLDETTGNTFLDFIGDNDGTGNLAPIPATGTVSGAQDFDGSTMGIDVNPSNVFDWRSLQSFTITLWVKTDGVNPPGGGINDNEVLIGRVEAGGIQWWIGLENGSGNASALLNDGAGNSSNMIGAGPSLTANTNWRHVALVRDGSTGINTLYVDGTAVATDTQPFPKGIASATAPLNIGYLGAGFHFDGSIDDVAIYRRALEASEIAANVAAGQAGTDLCGGSAAPTALEIFAPFPDDTISQWPLDEGIGSTDYIDAFGDNDGVGNAAPDAEANGRVAGAQDFDGSTKGIDVDPSSTFDWLGIESFTLELWVQTDGVNPPGGGAGDNEVLIGRVVTGGIQWWIGLENGSGNASAFLRDAVGNSSNMIGAGPSLTANTNWRHVALVRDGSTGTNTLYVDGFPEATDTDALAGGFGSLTAPLNIGKLGSGFYFNGLIDEVALYDRALEQPEIQDHIDAGVDGKSVTSLRPEPIANAGAVQSVTESDTVDLVGTGTPGYAGAPIDTYLWEQTVGTTVTLTGASTATATFIAPDVGAAGETLTFRLTVTADDGLSSSDTVNVTVSDSSVSPPVSGGGGGGGGGGCFINSLF